MKKKASKIKSLVFALNSILAWNFLILRAKVGALMSNVRSNGLRTILSPVLASSKTGPSFSPRELRSLFRAIFSARSFIVRPQGWRTF